MNYPDHHPKGRSHLSQEVIINLLVLFILSVPLDMILNSNGYGRLFDVFDRVRYKTADRMKNDPDSVPLASSIFPQALEFTTEVESLLIAHKGEEYLTLPSERVWNPLFRYLPPHISSNSELRIYLSNFLSQEIQFLEERKLLSDADLLRYQKIRIQQIRMTNYEEPIGDTIDFSTVFNVGDEDLTLNINPQGDDGIQDEFGTDPFHDE